MERYNDMVDWRICGTIVILALDMVDWRYMEKCDDMVDMVDMWRYLVLLAPDLQHLPVFRRSCANKSPAMFWKMCCLVISRKLLTNFLFMSSRVYQVRLISI